MYSLKKSLAKAYITENEDYLVDFNVKYLVDPNQVNVYQDHTNQRLQYNNKNNVLVKVCSKFG